MIFVKDKGVCMAVKDIKLAEKFYQELFGLEALQDYGMNISFGGLSLQQGFDRPTGIPKKSILEKSYNMELYFEEAAFDAFIQKLEQRSDIQYLGKGVEEAAWGQRSVRFYDLDSHIIEVGENMQMVVQRFLAAGMSMQKISKRMDVSLSDMEALLHS